MRRTVAAASVVAALAATLRCTPSAPSGSATDTDGDGLTDADEVNLYGTSPLLADTDGDGFTDFGEIVTHAFDPASDPYRFNPRVADMPQLGVELTSAPTIRISTEDQDGTTHAFETSRAEGNTITSTAGTTDTYSETDSLSTSRTVSQDVPLAVPPFPRPPLDAGRRDGAEQDAGDAGADSGAADASVDAETDAAPDAEPPTVNVSDTFNPSTSIASIVTFSDEQSQEWSETLAATESWAESHQVTAMSGTLKASIELVNPGWLGYRLNSIVLTSYTLDSAQQPVPIGNLTLDMGIYSTFAPFALAAGARTAPVVFVREGLSLETTREILRDTSAIVIQFGVAELDDLDAKPYEARTGDIAAKTAVVAIDYGEEHPAQRFRVATNLDPARPGVGAARVLEDILRIPFEADASGLVSVRDVGEGGGLPKLRSLIQGGAQRGRWVLTRTRGPGPGAPTKTWDPEVEPYDLRDVELRSGDLLRISWIEP